MTGNKYTISEDEQDQCISVKWEGCETDFVECVPPLRSLSN